jgi:queuine tRNA-ribosyltransferase
MMMDVFRLERGGGQGPRAGILNLPSGISVETPLFMPVATKMSVKTLEPDELARTGTSTVITNGFLSSLEPGSDVIRTMGGMHEMMGWDGGIFSDSGGFQFIRKGFDADVSDEGVALRSPYNGEKVFITPESVVDMHARHGVDVGMVLDHCPPYPSSADDLVASSNRTMYWARRSMLRLKDPELADMLPDGKKPPLLFAITQGGTDPGMRRKCTETLVGMGFPGYGIGGLSIGESKSDTFRSLKASTSLIPEDRPRYFMGVGDPDDVVRSVMAGVDIFDSVFPTRNARHRSVFTHTGRENIRASGWKGSEGPIRKGCKCDTCRRFSRAYLYHLFKAGEPLGPRLATVHNIFYLQELVSKIRKMILDDDMTGALTSTGIMDP